MSFNDKFDNGSYLCLSYTAPTPQRVFSPKYLPLFNSSSNSSITVKGCSTFLEFICIDWILTLNCCYRKQFLNQHIWYWVQIPSLNIRQLTDCFGSCRSWPSGKEELTTLFYYFVFIPFKNITHFWGEGGYDKTLCN